MDRFNKNKNKSENNEIEKIINEERMEILDYKDVNDNLEEEKIYSILDKDGNVKKFNEHGVNIPFVWLHKINFDEINNKEFNKIIEKQKKFKNLHDTICGVIDEDNKKQIAIDRSLIINKKTDK